MKHNNKYERPKIVKQVDGLMNKVGRPALNKPFDKIDNVPVDELISNFGSPLFVFSERTIRNRLNDAKNTFTIRYPDTVFAWSYKTNYLDAILSIMYQEGSLAEVVSEMEYEKARRLGVPGNKIIYNGPCKTRASLERALKEGALIQMDHLDEIAEVEEIAKSMDFKPSVSLRINLDAGIYPQWNRFGFNLESGMAIHAVKRIVLGGILKLTGIHCHIGTFILDPLAYKRAVEKIIAFEKELESKFNLKLTVLNMGGGFASSNTLMNQYLPGDQAAPSFAQYADAITAPLLSVQNSYSRKLILETGRAIIDDAGYLIATVIGTKRLVSGYKSIVIDAGLNLLITALWYKLQILPAQTYKGVVEDTVVYGPLCMNIDCMRDAIPLPDLQKGDKVVIKPVGAYCVTQSWQFIKLRPAVVLIGADGSVDLIRRAETLDDIISAEILPERFKS